MSTNGNEQAALHEKALVKLYMELTGATEAEGRNVFMYICPKDEDSNSPEDQLGIQGTKRLPTTNH